MCSIHASLPHDDDDNNNNSDDTTMTMNVKIKPEAHFYETIERKRTKKKLNE